MRSSRLAAGLAAAITLPMAQLALAAPALAAEEDLVIDQPPEVIGDDGDPYEFTMTVGGLGDAGGTLSVALDISSSDPGDWLFEYESPPGTWNSIDVTGGTDITVAEGDVVAFRIATQGLGFADEEETENELCPILFGPPGMTLTAQLFKADDELVDKDELPIDIVHLSGGMDGLDTGEFDEASGEPIPLELVKGDQPTPFSMTVCNFSQSTYTDLFLIPRIGVGEGETLAVEDVTFEIQDPSTGEWEPLDLAPGPGGGLEGAPLFFDVGPFEEAELSFRIAFGTSTTVAFPIVGFLLVTSNEDAQFSRQHIIRLVAAGTTPGPSTTPTPAVPSAEPGAPSLPKTGAGNTITLIAIAAVLVAMGSALIIISRRRLTGRQSGSE